MADTWEDWDDAPDPAAPAAAEPDAARFAGEDAEEDEPAWKAAVPKPAAPRPKPPSRYDESRGTGGAAADAGGPLDDPAAERARRRRLQEESDLAAAADLFGGVSLVDLDSFAPKSAKDYEALAATVAARYVAPHAASPHYKALVKALLHAALRPLPAAEVKDVETAAAGVRADKLKAEKAGAGGRKTARKQALNVGRGGGTAGLDDVVYDDPLDDDFDFM